MGRPKRSYESAEAWNAYQEGIRDAYLQQAGLTKCKDLKEAQACLDKHRGYLRGPITQQQLARIEWFEGEVGKF